MKSADFGRVVRSELTPIMKRGGFGIRVVTEKGRYDEGNILITINEVPSNFQVFEEEYNYWDFTDNATKLMDTIDTRLENLIIENGVNVRREVVYDRKIKFKKTEKKTEEQ